MKIGLLIIATFKYIRFVPPLIESANKHFLPEHEKTYFCFTDAEVPPEGTIKIPVEHKPWPASTLLRYHYFWDNRDKLEGMDYLFYSDADMLFVDEVGNEVLGDLVATKHPGFYDKPRNLWTYEKNQKSVAYVKPHQGRHYFAGGFNGGRREHFLRMAQVIKSWIDIDDKRGITAEWHDESHMNRYMVDRPPTKILDPSYCYPESWELPFPKRLLALDKNHDEVRG